MTNRDDQALMRMFGVHYFAPQTQGEYHSGQQDLYRYSVYVGSCREMLLELGDSAWVIGVDGAEIVRGPAKIGGPSNIVTTVIRGYAPGAKSVRYDQRTCLPYVNGCSTRQLFPPERLGDPTLQLLDIPPHSAEQAHHIHSTARVVYVLRGRGRSIVGMDKATVVTVLTPGMVCILEPMCPHHFETDDDHLLCIPLHIFSSVGPAEHSHPMWNGTHLMNQGGH